MNTYRSSNPRSANINEEYISTTEQANITHPNNTITLEQHHNHQNQAIGLVSNNIEATQATHITNNQDNETTRSNTSIVSSQHNHEWIHSRNNINNNNNPTSLNEVTRMLFQNLHGIKQPNTTLSDSVQDLVHALEYHSISIANISEHHISAHHQATQVQLIDGIQKAAPRGHIHLQINSSQDPPSDTARLMGGTGIITKSPAIGRLAPKGNGGDPMGRWSYCNFKRTNNSELTVISIYQVCRQPTNQIGHTAWHQQRNALNKQERSNEHPRTAFINDLIQFIKNQQSSKKDIIVGGDWNDYLESPRSSIKQLCTTLNLVDPWILYNPQYQDFPTYERGQHRIDSILISQSLLPALRNIQYTPIGWINNSDHRGILVEWETTLLFGQVNHKIDTRCPRSLSSKDRQQVTTYVETTHQHLEQHNVFNRIIKLNEQCVLNPSTEDEVEKLDKLIGIATDRGEKKCKRRRSAWFSRPIVKTRLEISFLKHLRNGIEHGLLQKGIDRLPSTMTKLKTIESDVTPTNDPHELEKIIDDLMKRLHKLKQESFTIRQAEFQEKLSQLNTSKKPKDPRKKIKKSEVGLRTWKTIRTLKKGYTAQEIDRLDIPQDWPQPFQEINTPEDLSDPKTATQWKTIIDPQHIEYYLMLRNKLHFGQAQGTPFTIEPLSPGLDWGATSSLAQDILEGQYTTTTQTDNLCHSFLQHCKQSAENDLIPFEITTEEFAGRMKKWNEKTTTSPFSGRHLGRYKSLFTKGIYQPHSSEEAEQFTQQQQDIVDTMVGILNFCIRTGYVLSRWKHIHNLMIFKDIGNFQIHKLRVIHLYEADLNLLMAVKWRLLLKAADQQQLVNDSQYGGRPGREATTLALIEELKLDISYASRRTLITFDNDAASCYDRIIPSCASLIHRKYGMPQQITKLHGNLLQNAMYQLITPQGVSDTKYSHSEKYPIYGTGQGSGNSPVIWLLISATLFDSYEQVAQGATFSSPDGTETSTIKIGGFVDDTNTSLNSWLPQHQSTTTELLRRLKEDTQQWNDLLFVSGGKLELSKCSFHVLEFTFQPNGTPQVNGQKPQPIQLRDSITGNNINIPALSAACPHKTLGHWKAISGNAATQLKEIKTKTMKISNIISMAPIPRYGAKMAYTGQYVASLRYVLPQCHFDHRVLRKHEKTSMTHIISKCGFSQKTPTALLYAPIILGGGGFIHWEDIQGIGQIIHFIKHWRADTQATNILRIAVAWTQFQAGTQKSILRETESPLKYVEVRWIMSLRQALRKARSKLQLDRYYIPKKERDHDHYIMDIVRQSGAFSDNETRYVNYCRLYLHLTTLSEMFNVAGTKLLPHVVKGNKPPWFDPQVRICLQQRPDERQWYTCWKKLCRIVVGYKSSLGKWSTSTTSPRLRRETYQDNGQIFHWYDGSYWLCEQESGQPDIQHMQEQIQWSPTHESIPIDAIARIGKKIYIDSTPLKHQGHQQRPPKSKRFLSGLPTMRELPNQHDTFESYAAAKPQPLKDILSNITWYCPPFECIKMISQGTEESPILVVSDGSALESQRMSYGVVIATQTGKILAESRGPAAGPITSHRAECMGCLAGAMILQHLAIFTHTPQPFILHLKAYSDNKGMIKYLQQRWKFQNLYTNGHQKTDNDLLEEITHVYKQINRQSQVPFVWVKGHQDDKKEMSELPIEAKLNIMADSLAGQQIHESRHQHAYITPLFSKTRCSLEINNKSVHGNYTSALQEAMASREYKAYLMQKYKWTDKIYDGVDWDSFKMACRNYFSTEVHLLKLIHGFLPTRSYVSKFQPWVPSTCHYCKEKETFHHLVTCKCHPASKKFRPKLIEKIDDYFKQSDVPESFHEEFKSILQEGLGEGEQNILDSPTRKAQDRIGFCLFLRGFLSIKWRQRLCRSIRDDRLKQYCKDNPTDGPTNPYLNRTKVRINNTKTKDPINTTVFFAGIIKILWGDLGQLWLDHLALVHQTPEKLVHSEETVHNMRTHVSLIQKLKKLTCQEHRRTYFMKNPSTAIKKMKPSQLKQYIAVYKPAILASIKSKIPSTRRAATTISQRIKSMLTKRQPTPRGIGPMIANVRLTSHSKFNTHHALGEANHRKRNRLRCVGRPGQTTIPLITTYFPPPPI
jgi:ribonuclease HI